MNSLEREVVALIEEGQTRSMIAASLGIGNTKVRTIIRGLCERYGCGMWGLPAKVKETEK